MAGQKIIGHIAEKVCDLHARGVSTSQTAKELQKMGMQISQSGIWQYLNNASNVLKIQEAVEKYRANPLAVDMAHKRTRLEDLDKERRRIIFSISRICGDKHDTLGEIPKKGWSKYTTLLKRLVEIEIAGRDEIEKKPDMVAFFQRIGPLSGVTDEDLHKQISDIDVRLIERRNKDLSPKEGGARAGTDAENKGQSS